jgi:hypothetical protein
VADNERKSKTGRNLASNLFAVLAVVFAIVAVVLYLRPGGSGIASIPTAAPGGNQIINVTEALKAQGLDVQQPKRLFIPVGAFKVPGQGVEINGHPGFIFLYQDADAAQADVTSVDPSTAVPQRLEGTPAPPGERRVVQGSNVILLLIDGDDATWQKVQTAITGLP